LPVSFPVQIIYRIVSYRIVHSNLLTERLSNMNTLWCTCCTKRMPNSCLWNLKKYL